MYMKQWRQIVCIFTGWILTERLAGQCGVANEICMSWRHKNAILLPSPSLARPDGK